MVPDYKFSPQHVGALRRARESAGVLVVRKAAPDYDVLRVAARDLRVMGLLEIRGISTGADAAMTYVLTKEGDRVAAVTAAS